MNERLFIQLCELVLIIAVTIGILAILTATWHDLRTIRLKKLLVAHMPKSESELWPHLTVLIYAHNAEDTIIPCIASIQASNYTHCTIIIANNASTDATRKRVASYKRLHPGLPLRMYSAKRAISRRMLLHRALNGDRSEKILITLDANQTLPASTLRECVVKFISNRRLNILRLRRLPTYEVTIRTLIHYFHTLSLHTLLKSFAKYPYLYQDSLMKSGFAVRRSAMNEKHAITSKSVDYASNIYYMQSSIRDQSTDRSYTPLQIAFRTLLIVGLLVGIIMMSYFFYTAALLQSNLLLTLSWVAMFLWLLAATWLDNILPRRTKLNLTITVPFMYVYIYLYLFVSVILLFRKIISTIKIPNPSYDKLQIALLAELYSTRY